MKPAILIENLSKQYHIGALQQRTKSLKAALANNLTQPVRRLQQRLRKTDADDNGATTGADEIDTIWALKDISLEIMPGEVVGILGTNGSGKSTLMKVLGRVTAPTHGRIEVRGRVGSLLEVGTGFDQEFTGRENIYLSGPILGMSRKEIDEKFDQIIAFADIEKFLDTPVKHYSSGMQMRLGFAVAAHMDPEVLLVDEALSVGDTAFQSRCVVRMLELARSGRTVLFVSHDMESVRSLCARAIILNHGHLLMEGPTAPVLKEYAGILAGAVGATPKTEEPEPETDLHEQHVQTLLDAPLHEPPVEPLADEVASSLLNQLPEMLIEELVRRLGPTLAGHVSEYLALPTVKPAAPAEAEPTRFSTNGHAEPATPPAELTLHVSPPAPFWPDSPDNQMEFFEPRQWEPTPRVYSAYLAEANQHGMDVNDWLHQYLGWGDCGYLIHHTLRPWLTESSRVCELGAGSGRWARHVVPRLPHGGLHLVETTPWLVEFLRRYFHGQEQVHSHLVEGYTLPFLDSWFDLVYAFETLPASSLGKIDVFAREFARVLRPGGRCVLFYLDTSGPLTWDFLRNQGTPPAAAAESFAYHAPDSIDRVLQSAGLTVERRRHLCEVYPNHPLTSVVAVRQNLPVS